MSDEFIDLEHAITAYVSSIALGAKSIKVIFSIVSTRPWCHVFVRVPWWWWLWFGYEHRALKSLLAQTLADKFLNARFIVEVK